MDLILASNNAQKFIEFREAFRVFGVHVFSLSDKNIAVKPEETGKTFQENALIKARAVAKFTDLVVLADDSGLEIHALDNFPGLVSARFMGGCTYADKFLAIEKMLSDKSDRTANFTCALCVLNLVSDPLFFTAQVSGTILSTPRGINGFGYDPIFYYPELKKCFSEMSQDEKNVVSHRGQAVKLFGNYLKEKKYIK